MRSEFQQLSERIDRILNNVLGDIDRTRDREAIIEGFNKAWDVVRDIMRDEIQRRA